MYFSTMEDWLAGIACLNENEMELGLSRVKAVLDRLNLLCCCPVIMVSGTNGKGSCVAGLEAIYQAAGYRVGTFTSPFLFKYNEQVRINALERNDKDWCTAFEKVELARQGVPLTSFEFGTLAALVLLDQASLDLWILEVGLGGRLDAVNVMDADLAIVASIGIDHVEWLGSTRDAIAIEKAGIFRANQFAVCGDFSPPQTLLDSAEKLGTLLYCQGQAFRYQENKNEWSWSYHEIHYSHLPIPKLAIQNMSTVLMAVTLMQKKLPINRLAIDAGLSTVTLPARIQVIEGDVVKILDVSHNPASIQLLADYLEKNPIQGKTRAVFSMLKDKDIYQSILAIQTYIHEWHIGALNTKRAASLDLIKEAFQKSDINLVETYADVKQAYQAAEANSKTGDRVLIFGSFHTVAEVFSYKNK